MQQLPHSLSTSDWFSVQIVSFLNKHLLMVLVQCCAMARGLVPWPALTYFGWRRYFYGNGVFRSTFVGIIAGKNASVMENWLYSWVNTGVQLVSVPAVQPFLNLS